MTEADVIIQVSQNVKQIWEGAFETSGAYDKFYDLIFEAYDQGNLLIVRTLTIQYEHLASLLPYGSRITGLIEIGQYMQSRLEKKKADQEFRDRHDF